MGEPAALLPPPDGDEAPNDVTFLVKSFDEVGRRTGAPGNTK
jgi:hypothetical protein